MAASIATHPHPPVKKGQNAKTTNNAVEQTMAILERQFSIKLN